MRKGRILGALLVCLFIGGVTQATAVGKEVRYSGKSGQGRKVVLLTDDSGKLTRFVIEFKAQCGRGFLDHAIQRFAPPFRQVDENGFRDGGTYNSSLAGGRTVEVRTRLQGKRVGDNSFEGSFSFKGKYFTDEGEMITTCRTPAIHWSVSH